MSITATLYILADLSPLLEPPALDLSSRFFNVLKHFRHLEQLGGGVLVSSRFQVTLQVLTADTALEVFPVVFGSQVVVLSATLYPFSYCNYTLCIFPVILAP